MNSRPITKSIDDNYKSHYWTKGNSRKNQSDLNKNRKQF